MSSRKIEHSKRDVMFDGVKVFSATLYQPRNALGERLTQWLAANPGLIPTEFVVRQSSDAAFHCITIVVFYRATERQ